MQTISTSEFKALILRFFRATIRSGEAIAVTNSRRSVLEKRSPEEKRSIEEGFRTLQGTVIYQEEIDTPTLGEWEIV